MCYIHMRNLSVFFTKLDWDFALVIELYRFKFSSHNLGIFIKMDEKSGKIIRYSKKSGEVIK